MNSNRQVTSHFFLIIPIILITSYLVWNVNVQLLQHNRNFYRTLNYHILQHQIIDLYWFGQGMLNYPINQYFQLNHFQQFLIRMHQKISNLEDLTYGEVDQTALNQTQQTIQLYYKQGGSATYSWTLQDGPLPGQPFTFDDINQIKAVLNQIQGMFFIFEDVDLGANNIWDLTFKVEPFSDTSMVVHIVSHQKINLASQHILTFIGGVLLSLLVLWEYYYRPQRRIQNILYYFLSFFLVSTSALAFSNQVSFQIVYMLDGVTCLAAWLCSIKFYLKDNDDYNLTFLLGQSYAMIGRLFASFGPLMMAFALFGYVVFSRYAGQFKSFWRTFLQLFYVCYYNMTYESMMVTARSNPISMIYWITFVILFTICIYSGMLVSVFCSYVWGKRQLLIKQDIQKNLRIQCSACDYKYKYSDCQKIKLKGSFNLSEYLHIDFKSDEGKQKYKRIMKARIQRLRTNIDQLIDQSVTLNTNLEMPMEQNHQFRDSLWDKCRIIKNLIGH